MSTSDNHYTRRAQLILPGLFDEAQEENDREQAAAAPCEIGVETVDADLPPTSGVFRPGGAVSFADVAACVRAEEPSLRRRDTLSALRVVLKRLELDARSVPATAEAVRALFARHGPVALGVTEPRWRNIRSLVIAAVEKHGMRRRLLLTKGLPLAPDWAILFERLDPGERHALSRLARYCTATGVPPGEVGKGTLLGFHEALVAESFVKDPRNILKRTIALANMAGKRLPDWQMPRLSSPFRTEPFMMPLSAFPASFGMEVERWVTFVERADPLDPAAPVKPLRPATITSVVYHVRRAASALVRGGHVPVEEMTGLAMLVEPPAFREALRAFLPAGGGAPPTDAARIARSLIGIAKNFLRLDATKVAELKAMHARLERHVPRGMGRRHRERVEQFDDPGNVRRLLCFPTEEAARARRQKNPHRRARGMERALATAILIDTGLRLNSLRTLRMDTSFRRAGGVVFLHVGAGQSKTDRPLDHVLPEATVALLDEFLRDHRPSLPGSDGTFLFPGMAGGPKSASAMRDCLSKALLRHTGIRLNPHAFRHVIGKIIVERDPGAYALVSRHLGHASMNTTLGSYLGTETKVASRHLHKIMDEARRGLPVEA